MSKLPLWQHQKEAIYKSLHRFNTDIRGYALFLEAGTGKSACAVTIVERIFAKIGKRNVVILAPTVVCSNWRDEFAKHAEEPHNVFVLLGSSDKRATTLRNNKGIFVTNYESLQMAKVLQELGERLDTDGMLILDECHKIKNPLGLRAQRAFTLAKKARYRLLLSGTPILNSPMDVFQQFKCMDLGDTFGENFYVFRAKYFYDANAAMSRDVHFPRWEVRPHALEEINKLIMASSFHVKKSECLDLPPLIKTVVKFELNTDQRRYYEAMKKDFIAYISDGSKVLGATVAQIALTKALRMQQICAGHMLTDDKKVIRINNNPRIKALGELLELHTATSKVIVWAVFKEDYAFIRELCEKDGYPYVELTGESKPEERGEIVNKFNNDPTIRVLIGNPGAAGIGINLVSSNVAIFYTRNFSLENDLQASARNFRAGSEIHDSVLRIDIVAENTIDNLVLKRLSDKLAMGDALLKDLINEI